MNLNVIEWQDAVRMVEAVQNEDGSLYLDTTGAYLRMYRLTPTMGVSCDIITPAFLYKMFGDGIRVVNGRIERAPVRKFPYHAGRDLVDIYDVPSMLMAAMDCASEIAHAPGRHANSKLSYIHIDTLPSQNSFDTYVIASDGRILYAHYIGETDNRLLERYMAIPVEVWRAIRNATDIRTKRMYRAESHAGMMVTIQNSKYYTIHYAWKLPDVPGWAKLIHAHDQQKLIATYSFSNQAWKSLITDMLLWRETHVAFEAHTARGVKKPYTFDISQHVESTGDGKTAIFRHEDIAKAFQASVIDLANTNGVKVYLYDGLPMRIRAGSVWIVVAQEKNVPLPHES